MLTLRPSWTYWKVAGWSVGGALALAVICISLVPNGWGMALSFTAYDDGVAKRIQNQLCASQGATFRLTDAAPYAWDQVIILSPYSGPQSVEAVIGRKWIGYGRFDMALQGDGAGVLVFLKGRKVVHAGAYRRDRVNYNLSDAGFAPIPRGQAVLLVSRGEPPKGQAKTACTISLSLPGDTGRA
jgi:hypothetical protein